ncbi:glucose-6-phosphate isomerase [Hyphomonas sp. FCG-A18]|uniref:glucose-6-phosphate isomerase n=1 Tax=Hyphomonas sp. FCG-A18 TaxID=3080019 RepID=UPI002B2E142C|nr:glucose-6-phosphate isomerase [Hyphomonas sp. FCG-A18]
MTDLIAHADRLSAQSLKSLATTRGETALTACGWTMDTARQYLDGDVETALLEQAEAAGLSEAIKALFSAEIVNPSEDRPALHWALRTTEPTNPEAKAVWASLQPAFAFAESIRDGTLKTPAGERFSAILHIGIGGSDFGPRLIADAFADKTHPEITLRFAANVDPFDLERALNGLDPATTLVIGVSKSFGTEETLYNLGRARKWLEARLGEAAVDHLALVTSNPQRAAEWLGKQPAHLFDMPASIGGRFSLWSTASLSCIIALGVETFKAILAGAEAMDSHVQTAPMATNMPVQLALLDYWNATIRGEKMRVALAYASRLRMLPAYLQQLEMESNGKTVSPDGAPVAGATAPALWGGEGSIGQHSYHQWLHQGAQSVPTEFILALDKGAEPEGQTALIAHCLAQAEVLANGRSFEEVKTAEPDLPDHVAAQKVHAGGRPSTLLSCADFTPQAFGSLLALYEHRTYLAGKLWGLNPFDQWGVERGKTMAGRLKPVLRGEEHASDPITARLIDQLKR